MTTNNMINTPEPFALASGGTGATTASGAFTNISAGMLTLSYVGSSVNLLNLFNNSTGNFPGFNATGTDAAVGIQLGTKNSSLNLVDTTNTIAPPFKWYNAAQTHFTSLAIATAQSTNLALILPATDAATSHTPLSSDASGNLSFSTTPFLGAATATTLAFTNNATGGLIGTATNDSAPAGKVGELISSVILASSAVSVSANTQTNVTSISLTAGDWDVWGNLTMVSPATTTSGFYSWISSTSATAPDSSLYTLTTGALTSTVGQCAPQKTFQLASTTTIYISTYIAAASGTGTVCGGIYARRRR